jgi:hypothetical protein
MGSGQIVMRVRREEASMERKASSSVVWAVVLILLGVVALALQLAPSWQEWFDLGDFWPLIVVGGGVALLAIGALTEHPRLAVPACVLGGIGGLLAWQVYTADWESWAYVWTLIPGFVGVGLLLAGLLGHEVARSVRSGVRLLVVSAILFAAFTAFFSMLGFVGPYWPVQLIVVGVLLLAWSGMDAWQRYAAPREPAPAARPAVEAPLRRGADITGSTQGRAV